MQGDSRVVNTLSVALVGSFVGFLVTALFWALAVHGAAVLGSGTFAMLAQNALAALFSVPIAIYVARSSIWKPSHKIAVIITVGFGSVVGMIAYFVSQVASDTWIFWPAAILAFAAIVAWFGGFWFWVGMGLKMAIRRQHSGDQVNQRP